MFSKKTIPVQMDTVGTVLGRGSLLEAAKLSGKESVRIDGAYFGKIDIEENLVVGDTGHITGDIKAKYIVVAGRIDGNILCESVLHLASTARVVGDIVSKALVVDEGSQLLGRYEIGDSRHLTTPEKPSGDGSYLDKSMELVDNTSPRDRYRANHKDNKYNKDQTEEQTAQGETQGE
jgi:cytoskeletal protein CcmA (bactofilin family)